MNSAWLELPERDDNGNKGSFGTLTAVCGSRMYRGAAYLCTAAALRSGVGIVRLAAPECVIASVSSRLAECVYLPLPDFDGDAALEGAITALLGAADKSAAMLIGCGLGNNDGTKRIVRALLSGTKLPLILDADALNSIAPEPSILNQAAGRTIITPHIGEFSRLTGIPIVELKHDPERFAAEFAKEHGCVTVLKDAVTRIAAPDGRMTECGSPNSGLAKGGSGDVLAGITASLAAQGMELYEAAVSACRLHSEAGRLCAERLTKRAMLPSDLIGVLIEIFCDLQ